MNTSLHYLFSLFAVLALSIIQYVGTLPTATYPNNLDRIIKYFYSTSMKGTYIVLACTLSGTVRIKYSTTYRSLRDLERYVMRHFKFWNKWLFFSVLALKMRCKQKIKQNRHKTHTLTTELHEHSLLEAGFEPAAMGLLPKC